MISLGIDASPTATGLVLLQSVAVVECIYEAELSKLPGHPVGVARAREIAGLVMGVIHRWKPDIIVIEGYGLNLKHASSIIPIVELGGILRLCMHLDGLTWFDPTPPDLKKFVTGKGNSAKDQVMMYVLKRWGHTSKTNNTADAYALAAMGLAHEGGLPKSNQLMQSVAMKMKPNTT